ncbi:MAG: T9SS type A sorting domain-containing protein [Candidatus Cloacimonetes bacterium]|nr:T9SS type A sorting domain-containing protein [Candidatus Cloacimonadota bacterium]
MKKYILIALMLITAYNIFCCDMAAAITTHEGGVFYFNYPDMDKHYCVELNVKLNSCPRDQGRRLIFYDSNESDGIWHYRPNSVSDPILQTYYDTHILTSNVMLSHARVGTTGDSIQHHPFIWESRTDDKTYAFMANGDIDMTALEGLLEEGSDSDWLDDAITYLHDNPHNVDIESYDDICDSELFFYWIIKNIEANRDVIKGLEQAIYRMNRTTEIGHSAWKNFVFSDGGALYIYKNGTVGYDDYDHQLFWGEAIIETGGVEYDQHAYVVTSTNIGPDFNIDVTPPYQELENELSNFELVVLHSNGAAISYPHFGEFTGENNDYPPEVNYFAVNGVNWKCFPVDYSGYTALTQLEETQFYLPILYYYNYGIQSVGWSDFGLLDLEYTQGYKLELDNIQRIGLLQYGLNGVHVFEDREILLDSQQNRFWIPYFMHGSASVYDAFDDIIDDAVQIIGQYWTMWRKSTGYSWNVAIDPGKNLTCYYGKMYDVTLASGHPTVMDYYDIMGYEEMEEYIPPQTVYYEYEEKLEYEAILIDTIVSNEPIEEVAVFEGGECIGASVFQGYPVFIRAFTEELNRTNEPLEFRVYTGSRTEPDVEYRVFDEDFAYYRDESMYPRENVITRVCLGLNGEEMPVMSDNLVRTKQYPDPFNPETAIEYSLPEYGNVCIDIYNIKGQKVKNLLSSEKPAGLHKVIWNGTDDSGRRSASGMYFYVLIYNEQIIREKMLMIK